MLLKNEQIKAHCRIDPDCTAEDALLELYAQAAEKKVTGYLNRNIYATDVPDSDAEGLTADSDIRLAMLTLISHWYENRSAVSHGEQAEAPLNFYDLIRPYRLIPL